jgi:hypothetical protein
MSLYNLKQVDQSNPVLIGSTALHRRNDVQTKPNQPMKTFNQYLKSLEACQTAIDWAGDKTIEQVVADCHRGDWLLWLAKKCGVELQPLTLAKAHCVNTVRHLMTDERSIKAVDVAIAFGEGRATRDELDTAAYANAAAAAYAYANAAAYAKAYANAAFAAAAAAAACASDDADTAAYANATAAAYAAANASDDAYANLRQTADICRKFIGDLIIEKVNQHLNQTNQ